MADDDAGAPASAENPFVHRGPDDTAGDLRILETVVDDVSPELLGGLQDRLAEVGAHHVSVFGITTKDARPGHLVRATTHPDDADRVARTMARETGSLGVRELRAAHRFVAETTERTATIDVDGETYDIPVKLAVMDGEVYDVSAEYDVAAAVAAATTLSTRAVLDRAERTVDPDRHSSESRT